MESQKKSEYLLCQTLVDCARTTRTLCTAGKYLISGNYDKKVNVYELDLTPQNSESSESGIAIPQYKLVKNLDMFDSFVLSVDLLLEAGLLAVGCASGGLYLLGLDDGFLQMMPDAHSKRIGSVSISMWGGKSIYFYS